jgi:hypothetical protein
MGCDSRPLRFMACRWQSCLSAISGYKIGLYSEHVPLSEHELADPNSVQILRSRLRIPLVEYIRLRAFLCCPDGKLQWNYNLAEF